MSFGKGRKPCAGEVDAELKALDSRLSSQRQELEALERDDATSSPLLSHEEAAALILRADRSAGALTYGWVRRGRSRTSCTPLLPLT